MSEKNNPLTRLESLKAELIETTNIRTSMFIERDIAVILKEDNDIIAHHNKEIGKLRHRLDAIEKLIENASRPAESNRDFQASMFIVNHSFLP